MENISCTITLESQNQKIILSGIQYENIQIDYSGDIDFTPLVTILAELIDFEKIITLSDIDLSHKTEKEKLVIESLVKIIDAYNASINQDLNSVNQTQEVVAPPSDDLIF